MGLFGRKDNDDKEKKASSELSEEEQLDMMIMSAIDEAEEEEAQRKKDRRDAELKRIEKMNEERARQQAEAEIMEKIKSLPNQGRRYFLITETSRAGSDLLELTGKVFGEIKTGDEVFLYRPDNAVIGSSVIAITSDSGEMAEGAKNAHVTVSLAMDLKASGYTADNVAPKFSVLSDVKRENEPRPNVPVENPFVVGLSLVYKELHGDREYMKVLLGNLVRSVFVLPVHKVEGELKLITVNDKTDKEKRNLPVFTDMAALGAWKDVFNEEHKPSVTFMPFREASKLASKNDMSLLLNPFGPVGIMIPKQFISDFLSKFPKNSK